MDQNRNLLERGTFRSNLENCLLQSIAESLENVNSEVKLSKTTVEPTKPFHNTIRILIILNKNSKIRIKNRPVKSFLQTVTIRQSYSVHRRFRVFMFSCNLLR